MDRAGTGRVRDEDMNNRFRDIVEAGRLLAGQLTADLNWDNVIVMGPRRGGVRLP